MVSISERTSATVELDTAVVGLGVVHDHTSILSFLETKWNLPALTYRDANASNLLDFFDFSHPAFADAPSLAAPADPIAADSSCTTDDPNRPVEPARG